MRELDKLLFDHKNTFHLYHIGRFDKEIHDKACQDLMDYINKLKADKSERSLLRKCIAELEALNAQKDAAITEHQRISNEQLQKIRELKSSKCEDAPPPKWLGDAMDREKPLLIEEQIRRIFDRIGSKDDQLKRLQSKVENMDSRLDLNVAARKRIDDLEQRIAQLEYYTGNKPLS